MILTLFIVSISFTPFVSAASLYTDDSPNIMIKELKYDPYPLEAGKYVTLWIKIDNYGSKEAENVSCTLLPKYPFLLDSTENPTQTIGILPGMESAIIDYKIYVDSNAVEGNNDLDMACQASGGEALTTRTITLYVTSKIPEFAVGSISSQPTKLLPDTKDNQVKIQVQNIGTGDADMITAKLILPKGLSPSESYSNTANLGAIGKGSVKEATFYIDTEKSLEPKVYTAQLEIYYRDSNSVKSEYKSQIINADISIRPAPVFEVETVSTIPAKLTQGDKFDLNIVLKNTGYEEAKSVSFKLYKQNDQPFTLDEKYDFVGNIKPNETGQAGLKITVNSDAAIKTHLLEGEIRYVVGNDVFVVDKQIPISVMSAKDSAINPLYIIIAGVIVLALIGIYYARRKKKK